MTKHQGLSTQSKKAIAESLGRVLAETYALYLKTQNFHWNVEGRHFHDLHIMFEGQYKELAGAVDGIAERIRALGHYAPGGLALYARLSAIKDEDTVPNADDMVRRLAEGHETVAATSHASLLQSQEAGDEPTADLMIERLAAHEKTVWMLRSLLK